MQVVASRIESGLDDPEYLGHFLVGQVGLIHKLNYLDVTCISNRSHVLWKKILESDKRVNFGSGECTEPSLPGVKPASCFETT